MKKDHKRTPVQKKQLLSEDDVREYLILNPSFFDQNTDLLALLKPARSTRTDNVADFHAVLLERLQAEISQLNDMQGSLIHASRSNMTTQARIHAAVLCLLEATKYDHLCHIVSNDWVDILQVDTITICFEKDDRMLPENSNIRLLKKGVVDKFLGHENAVILRGNVTAAEEIFGPATPLIKAEAIIRIPGNEHHPQGILAFGSRDENFFTPGQGTELLQFLEATFKAQLITILTKAMP